LRRYQQVQELKQNHHRQVVSFHRHEKMPVVLSRLHVGHTLFPPIHCPLQQVRHGAARRDRRHPARSQHCGRFAAPARQALDYEPSQQQQWFCNLKNVVLQPRLVFVCLQYQWSRVLGHGRCDLLELFAYGLALAEASGDVVIAAMRTAEGGSAHIVAEQRPEGAELEHAKMPLANTSKS
jgi:hypothetical protein